MSQAVSRVYFSICVHAFYSRSLVRCCRYIESISPFPIGLHWCPERWTQFQVYCPSSWCRCSKTRQSSLWDGKVTMCPNYSYETCSKSFNMVICTHTWHTSSYIIYNNLHMFWQISRAWKLKPVMNSQRPRSKTACWIACCSRRNSLVIIRRYGHSSYVAQRLLGYMKLGTADWTCTGTLGNMCRCLCWSCTRQIICGLEGW